MKLIKEPELPKQSWRKRTEQVYPPRLQTILQSYRNQNSIVLAWKLAYESMDRIENSEINPHTYGQLIFDKRGENTYNWEKTVSLACGVGKVGSLHVNQWSWDTSSAKKISSKWLKDWNIRHDTIKLGETILWHKSYQCFLRSVS